MFKCINENQIKIEENEVMRVMHGGASMNALTNVMSLLIVLSHKSNHGTTVHVNERVCR